MSCFTQCKIFGDKSSTSIHEEEYLISDTDDEQEVLILAIRARAMEAKLRRKGRLRTESLHRNLFSTIGELSIPPNGVKHKEDNEEGEEAFFSVGSCFSRSSSSMSKEAFFDVGNRLSRCSSVSTIELKEVRRNSMLQLSNQCMGWPFGLCWKAVLLPPLPRSPAESWSWRGGTRIVKMP